MAGWAVVVSPVVGRGPGRTRQGSFFNCVSCKARGPSNHPLQPILTTANEAPEMMAPVFEGLWSQIGQPTKLAFIGHAVSSRVRQRTEALLGWVMGGCLRKTRHRSTARIG